jgi:hypothetical protein
MEGRPRRRFALRIDRAPARRDTSVIIRIVWEAALTPFSVSDEVCGRASARPVA